MAEYWVDIIRREVSFERYTVWVEADSAKEARSRVTEHYMGDGDVLNLEEEISEQHVKHLDLDESEVVEVGDAVEAA